MTRVRGGSGGSGGARIVIDEAGVAVPWKLAAEVDTRVCSGVTGVVDDDTQNASGIELCGLGVSSDESL